MATHGQHHMKKIKTLSSFLPEDSFVLRVLTTPASACVCVCVFVCVCVCQSRGCQCDNPSPVQARTTKFEKIQNTLVKISVVWGTIAFSVFTIWCRILISRQPRVFRRLTSLLVLLLFYWFTPTKAKYCGFVYYTFAQRMNSLPSNGSGNGLLPSGDKPLPEPLSTKTYPSPFIV